MNKYKKKALLKFTLIYFLSTSIFIIVLGYLYFSQQKNLILQKYALRMHHYVITLKQTNFKYKQDNYSYKLIDDMKVKYQLPIKENDLYVKVFPQLKSEKNIQASISSWLIDDDISSIKNLVIKWQITLNLLFLIISFILAKISLKPMEDTISHLDRFIKDLIHDLNTPATSILLNAKMLDNEIKEEKVLKKINRIKHSAQNIASLYENLDVFLSNNTKKTKVNLYSILNQKEDEYKIIYPNIEMNIENKEMLVNTNEKAIRRIIDNILSNSCKYSSEKPKIDIRFKQNKLVIKDNGKGIKFPKKVFERSYTENEHGHGIGMHIVYKLAMELDLDIKITSKEKEGTIIELVF